MKLLAEACERAIRDEDGELAGIACRGLRELLDATRVGYAHDHPEVWLRSYALLKKAWRVWREKGAPVWVGSPEEEEVVI